MRVAKDIMVKNVLFLFAFSYLYLSLTNQTKYSKLEKQIIDSTIEELSLDNLEKSFDTSYIHRVEERMYFDLGFVIQQDLYRSLKEYVKNVDSFFFDIAIEMSRIFSWNNMDLNLKQLDIKEIDIANIGVEFRNFTIKYNNTLNKLKGNMENLLNYYIIYLNSSTIFHGHSFGHFFCAGYTIILQDIQYMGELSAKNIAERTARDIIIPPSVIHGHYQDCICPYNNSNYCFSLKGDINSSNKLVTKIFTKCEILWMLQAYGRYGACLFQNDPRPSLYIFCGDGVVHETEECDCGTEFMCKMTGQDNCCNQTTCRFKKETYQCAHGVCCKDCRFVINTICRASVGECDPAELCNGTFSECPTDYVYEHYTMCNDNSGICINGMCSNFDSLCKYVYKQDFAYFDDSCYDFILSTLKNECENKVIDAELKYTCNRLDKCKIFTCATNQIIQYIGGTSTFVYGNKFCMIPHEKMLIGWFAHSPNYLKCGDDDKHYCYDSICTQDPKFIKNCQGGYCRDINNTIHYEMEKQFIFQAFFFLQIQYNFGIYLNTVAKKVPVSNKKIIIISILLFCTANIILLCVWKRKILIFYYYKIMLIIHQKNSN